MANKSLFGGVLGKKPSKAEKSVVESSEPVESDGDDTIVDHLWMTKDDKKNKKNKKLAAKKDPRIDTGILRNRIADKIAKMSNY